MGKRLCFRFGWDIKGGLFNGNEIPGPGTYDVTKKRVAFFYPQQLTTIEARLNEYNIKGEIQDVS